MREQIVFPMSPKEQKKEIERIKMASKHKMFNSFGTTGLLDSKIIDTEDSLFTKITSHFNSEIEYAIALDEIEEYIRNGIEPPLKIN